MVDDSASTTRAATALDNVRLHAATLAMLAIAGGLAVREWTGGAFAKYGGVALWATVVYGLVMLIAPSISRIRTAAIALGVSWLVELLQLTPLPSYLSSKHVVLRLVFGTTFHSPDLPAYVAGVAIGLAIDRLLLRRQMSPDR